MTVPRNLNKIPCVKSPRATLTCPPHSNTARDGEEFPNDNDLTNRAGCRARFRSDPLEPTDNWHRLHGDDRQPPIWLDTFHNSHCSKIWLVRGADRCGLFPYTTLLTLPFR